MWKKHSRVRKDTSDITLRRVSFVRWINKATDTPRNKISYCFSTATMFTPISF